ncbi:MAG: hypothetical protein L3J83_10905 [Proteobacteria bacterium]|nr:hypothetical protein [Pseudomonadota bacterium]
MSKLSLPVVNRIEKQIRVASEFQYISSDKSEQIIEALRQISVRSGMAIYIWSSGLGLVNIKSRQTPLPATRSVLEALKYASKNHYFAVYVFPGNDSKDLLEIKSTLPKALSYLKVNQNTRFLFLTNKDVRFNFLATRAEEIILHDQNTKRYKLRDGEWVLSDG